jgi:hypothetical protein
LPSWIFSLRSGDPQFGRNSRTAEFLPQRSEMTEE